MSREFSVSFTADDSEGASGWYFLARIDSVDCVACADFYAAGRRQTTGLTCERARHWGVMLAVWCSLSFRKTGFYAA